MRSGKFKTLYKIDTVDDYDGSKSFAYISPTSVSALIPDVTTIYTNENFFEPEGAGARITGRDITGTRIVTETESFFVPYSQGEVAIKLCLNLEEENG